jgi:hypothetical protein
VAQNRCESSIPYERPCIIEVQRAQKQCPTRSWRHGRASKIALHSAQNARHPRAAKDETLHKLAAHNTVSLHLVTPVMVLVAPTGPTGELTVHYDRGTYLPIGLRWEGFSEHLGRPPLRSTALADHLGAGTTEVTPDTWRGFSIRNLRSWDWIKTTQTKLFKPCAPVREPASAYRPGTNNETMQPVQDVMALMHHHGLVGDDAVRAIMLCSMLCSAPIDAASQPPSVQLNKNSAHRSQLS